MYGDYLYPWGIVNDSFYFLCSSVMYGDYLYPWGLVNDSFYLANNMVPDILHAFGEHLI